jgi:hypothetical protein
MVRVTRPLAHAGIAVGLSVATALVACGPRHVGPSPEAATCVFEGQLTLDTIGVVIDAGSFGAGLFQTLFKLRCSGGSLVPVLATSLDRRGVDGTWRIRLREDAHFTDGTPLTASFVKASWLAHEDRAPHPWMDSVERSVELVDSLTLEVRLLDTGPSGPNALADPRMAISREDANHGWGIGTGRYAPELGASIQGAIVAVPVGETAADRLPVIRYLPHLDDPRDALDQGVGLLRVRDLLTVEYARSLPGYTVHSLDADRIYVLVAPSRRDGSGTDLPTSALRQLSGDRSSPVAAQAGPPWWVGGATCPSASATASPADLAARIAYPTSDPTARDLAERLVALARTGSLDSVIPGLAQFEGRLGARPYPDDRFDAALARGESAAFVLPVSRFPFEICTAAHELQRRMPWASLEELVRVMVPLVETGAYAIIREGIGPVEIGWDRSVYLAVVRR